MSELPDGITRGEKARLFPILSERSMEGRTLSIFLATLVQVQPFAATFFGRLGKRVGSRTDLKAYTEVCFKNGTEQDTDRPDGLIILNTGKTRWTALVEAKVRKTELTAEQITRYLKLAKSNGIDAVITLSNQFSSMPLHHPVAVSVPKGIELYHCSWMQILTDAFLLLNDGVEDSDQAYILDEFKRFISHDSAGVESFTQMPPEWTDVVTTIQTGGNVAVGPAREVVGAWHQECNDLSLIFSRQIDASVTQKLTRALTADPNSRIAAGIDELRRKNTLTVEYVVPDAAANLTVCVDLAKRTISISMYLVAPQDKKRNSARINWLLRQLPKDDLSGLYLRVQWPSRSVATQLPLVEAIEDSDALCVGKDSMSLIGFEVLSVRDLGHRFNQRQTFIKELEEAVPDFWERVGQNLQAWVKPAPRLKEERSEPDAVSPSAISDST